MKRCLKLISILFLLCSSPCIAKVDVGNNLFAVDSVNVKEYSLLANIRGREMTGICVVRISADSAIVGTVVSEFGIKAFDFCYAKGKIKILHIMSHLDKWYIRKVLRKDFGFILSNMFVNDSALSEKGRIIKKTEDGRITVENKRHKISYYLLPLTEKE